MHVSLPRVEPGVFQIWLHWLHTGEPVSDSGSLAAGQEDHEHEQRTCIELYLLAKMMRSEEFRSHITDIMGYRITYWDEFTTALIIRVHDETEVGSSLRTFVVSSTIAKADRPTLDQRIRRRQLPDDFAAEIISQMFRQNDVVRTEAPFRYVICKEVHNECSCLHEVSSHSRSKD